MTVARQPQLGVSYLDLVYKPMLELFDLLEDNGFRVLRGDRRRRRRHRRRRTELPRGGNRLLRKTGVHPGRPAPSSTCASDLQALDLQAAPLAAVTPFTGSGGTDAAFVTDPGQQINPKTKDWFETFVPNQTGADYTAHLTVGFATIADLKAMQAEPFVRPVGPAYHLGNNGTARTKLKAWPLN